MNTESLIKAMLAQREFWVDLGDGHRVKLRRPAEMEVAGMLVREGEKVVGIVAKLPEVIKQAVDWEGFVESDLIGAAGASDAVPFATALWAAVVADRANWCATCATALVDAIVDHEKRSAAISGN